MCCEPPLRRLVGAQVRIFAFQHQAATGSRHDHIIPLRDPGMERGDIAPDGLSNRSEISGVKGGHAAAALLGDDDLYPVFFQNLDGGFAHVRDLVVHEAA